MLVRSGEIAGSVAGAIVTDWETAAMPAGGHSVRMRAVPQLHKAPLVSFGPCNKRLFQPIGVRPESSASRCEVSVSSRGLWPIVSLYPDTTNLW
jgi:hypothetical protein